MSSTSKEDQLSLAIKLAVDAHYGQFDKGGKPYILHPIHLMNQCMFDYQLAAIAVGHDIWEDSRKYRGHMRDFQFSERIFAAWELLTHDPADDYLDVYIPKICGNYDALRVKRKDLEHNSAITRLKGIRQKDKDRIIKYHAAFLILGEAKKNFER